MFFIEDKKIRIITEIFIIVVLISVILSSCNPKTVFYYCMDKFTDEQTANIRTAFDISNQVNVTLVSLTEESAWRDLSFLLVFAVNKNERDLFNENLPSELEYLTDAHEETRIVFNDIEYYLSREATGGRNNSLKEFLPIDDTGIVLYFYRCFNYGLDIHGMAKKYGEEAAGFPM